MQLGISTWIKELDKGKTRMDSHPFNISARGVVERITPNSCDLLLSESQTHDVPQPSKHVFDHSTSPSDLLTASFTQAYSHTSTLGYT
jgi:hypothetical protein